MMRKIAANYILLPGYPMVKNGYVVLDEGGVVDVVDTGGIIREIPGLEFYGGLLVADCVRGYEHNWVVGQEIVPEIEAIYVRETTSSKGVVLVQGIDYPYFIWTDNASIVSLV